MSDLKQRMVRFPKGSVSDQWAQNQDNFSLSVRKLVEAIVPIYGDGDYIDVLNKMSIEHLKSELNTSDNIRISTSKDEVTRDVRNEPKHLVDTQEKLEENTSNNKHDDDNRDPFHFLS